MFMTKVKCKIESLNSEINFGIKNLFVEIEEPLRGKEEACMSLMIAYFELMCLEHDP